MNEDEARNLRRKIDAGVKAGVARALEEHRRMGRKVVVWQDGRVMTLPVPDPLPAMELREKPPTE